MKIAITSPVFWPYGRRGLERYTFELGNFFSGRGHEVTVITSKPGKSRIQRRGKTTVIYHRSLEHPIFKKSPRFLLHTFVLSCFFSLFSGKFDIAHSSLYPDGLALSINRITNKTKYVFQVINPPNLLIGGLNTARWMLNRSLAKADRIVSISHYIKSLVKEELGYESEVFPIPVDYSFFRPVSAKRVSDIRILYAGSLMDPRKRLDLLIEAFNLLIRRIPDAILQLSGPVDPGTKKRLLSRIHPDAKDSVQILGPGKLEDMPRLYSEASVTVLPSFDEAQGMVLTESLACGTPVVGTNQGGIPEIISDPQIGTLFTAGDLHSQINAEQLCDAILRTLELAEDAKTSHHCRQHALKFSWQVIGPQIEQLYFKVVDAKVT